VSSKGYKSIERVQKRVRQREVLLENVLLFVKKRKVSFPGEAGCGA